MRLWADHRLAAVISGCLLLLGLLITPWALLLVLLVGFGGPLLSRTDGARTTGLSRLGRVDWAGLALGLAVVLLALNMGKGLGALILALIPLAWVLLTDRSLLRSAGSNVRRHQQIALQGQEEANAPTKNRAAGEFSRANSSMEGDSISPLTNSDLLAKIRQLDDVGKSSIVRACGYVSKRSDGTERLNFTAFYEALLEAKDIDVLLDPTNEDSDDDLPTNEQLMNLPADWKKLDDSEIVNRLKNSADVSAEVLTALAGSDDWEVRRAVAWHDNTPKSVLKILEEDDDSDVRQAIGDRYLPREWRYRSQDEKVSALQSDQIKADIIEVLARSENWSLRQAVAWSPSTSDAVLSRLEDDGDDDVQFAARQERQLPVEWRFLSVWEKAERLAEQAVDESILRVLAQAQPTEVRRAVALHEGTSQALLDKLAEDDDPNVQSGVRERQLPDQWKALADDDLVAALREPGVAENVLEILAGSGNWSIRQAVALSPSALDSVLERLANDEDTDVQSAVRERGLPAEWTILDEDEKVDRLNEGPVDTNILEILARSGRWTIRQAVAQNSGTAEATLQDLLQDDDDDVQSAAGKNLKKRGAGDKNVDATIPWDQLFSADEDKDGFERSPFENVPHLLEPLSDGEKLLVVNLGVIEEECDEYVMNLSESTARLLPDDCVIENGRHVANVVSHGKARVVLGWKLPDDRQDLLVDLERDWSEAKVNGEKTFDESLRPSFVDYGSTSTSPSEFKFLRRDATWYVCLPDDVEWEDRESTCLDEDRGTGYYSNYFESREEYPYQVAFVTKSGKGYVIEAIPESELANFKTWILQRLDGPSSSSPSLVVDNDDGNHSIYIKTEPGGRIAFGALDLDQIQQLQESIASGGLGSELEDLRYNSCGSLNECDGVVNSGDEGDSGNEGTIVFSTDQPALGPSLIDDGSFEDGVYIVWMRLSKCSIEFEFSARGGFDKDELEEISVPVKLPEEIVHGLYGHPNFNIITGFRFRGEPVDEYEGEVEDRGYDDQLMFFAIKAGEVTVLYSNYNGEEEWCDEDKAKTVLSSFL